MRSTALRQFQRLEAPGSWRPAPDAQLREVVVSIGEATLILSDPKSDAPLAHWSLPAVRRMNPGTRPAVYVPVAAEGDGPFESLEVDDRWMIDAIGRVQAAIAARRPHPGRLRGGLMAGAVLVMLLAGAVWLPGAMRSHAARITPAAERQQIGLAILRDMSRTTGAPCADPAAAGSLHLLAKRIGLPAGARIAVLREGLPGAIMLPGHVLAVDHTLIRDQSEPEALAGHMLAAYLTAAETDPMVEALAQVPFSQILGLLTRGTLRPDVWQGYGEALLSQPPKRASERRLLEGFAAAKLPSSPYAETLPDSGTRAVALTESDPFRSHPYPPALDERDWITLQQICIGQE
ncbi:hypothetical protein [Paracoccus jeotgali]|uniref:hypothetical protein n=1 Tax=Paracoccus jeotgali TaxID=2065379 RepID=UPI0028ADD290|nr:hypothetical protein [Paracoccus jeotgali]